MIKATFGLKQEPFNRNALTLQPQQRKIADIINIHAQHGGFSVVIGPPGVGKTVLREHLEALAKTRDSAYPRAPSRLRLTLLCHVQERCTLTSISSNSWRNRSRSRHRRKISNKR